MASDRFSGLPKVTVLDREVPVAVGLRARLLGLAGLRRCEAGPGLLIPRCASVHTFGMRFPLCVVFLDARNVPLAHHPHVPPRRLVAHRGAATVLELPAPPKGGESKPPPP